MARNPEVNYWASRGGFYSTIRGKQELLAKGLDDAPDGPTYRAAVKRFEELVFGKAKGPTLNEMTNRYLGWAAHNVSESSVSIRRGALAQIRKALGERPMDSLTGYDVASFCDQQRDTNGWSDGQVRLVLNTMKVMVNWAVEMGLLPSNPLGRLRPPPPGSRGLECVLQPEEEERIIAAARWSVRDLCQVLRDTGARPGELTKAEARHYDASMKALIFQATDRDRSKRHKTARTGRPRIVYLAGRSIEVVERLCSLHTKGPLFRTPGRRKIGEHAGEYWAWTQSHLTQAFERLRDNAQVPHFIPYSFRHTFAVRWLRERKPIAALAEVLGTSILMIQRHYGHLADQHDYLRRLVEELHASRNGASGPPPQ